MGCTPLYSCESRDVLLVFLSPLKRNTTPRTVEETKTLAHPLFLEPLCGLGHKRATHWLYAHLAGVGRESTMDVQKWFT